MVRGYRQLDLDERRRLFRLVEARVPVAVIARELGRHRSTIHREIGRNRVPLPVDPRWRRYDDHGAFEGYFPLAAQDLARQRRRRRGKLQRHGDLSRHVVARLEAGWSPQQIAGRLKLDSTTTGTVCHETIYQHVYGPEGREAQLWRLLPKSRRQRRPLHGRKPRASFVPPDRAILHRPPEVLDRQAFGHWEGDLLIFQKAHGKANLTSMVERQTRFTVLLSNPDRRSEALIGRIGQALQAFPRAACRTITFDRGTEFAAWPLLATQAGAEAWFCDPHSPWQKGAVENANGRIRRFLPAERNLTELAASELDNIAAKLNATPRRCLGWRTPKEAFEAQLAALALTA
jgi:IS30 family transposase